MLSAFRCQPDEPMFFLLLDSLFFEMKAQTAYSEGSQFKTRALGISFMSPRNFVSRPLICYVSLRKNVHIPMKSPNFKVVVHHDII